ncbi:hypothetical protein PENTCL1PPCAC_13934, partial [Pristionchus entomophagus]
RFYEKNGYIIIKKCVPPADIDRYIDRMKTICESPRSDFLLITVMRDVALSKEEKSKADMSTVMKINDWQDDPVLFEYCQNEKIVAIVKDLIG